MNYYEPGQDARDEELIPLDVHSDTSEFDLFLCPSQGLFSTVNTAAHRIPFKQIPDLLSFRGLTAPAPLDVDIEEDDRSYDYPSGRATFAIQLNTVINSILRSVKMSVEPYANIIHALDMYREHKAYITQDGTLQVTSQLPKILDDKFVYQEGRDKVWLTKLRGVISAYYQLEGVGETGVNALQVQAIQNYLDSNSNQYIITAKRKPFGQGGTISITPNDAVVYMCRVNWFKMMITFPDYFASISATIGFLVSANEVIPTEETQPDYSNKDVHPFPFVALYPQPVAYTRRYGHVFRATNASLEGRLIFALWVEAWFDED